MLSKLYCNGDKNGTVCGANQEWELAKIFREHETSLAELTGFRVKITEMNDTAVKNIMHDPNPWASAKCRRPDCHATLETTLLVISGTRLRKVRKSWGNWK